MEQNLTKITAIVVTAISLAPSVSANPLHEMTTQVTGAAALDSLISSQAGNVGYIANGIDQPEMVIIAGKVFYVINGTLVDASIATVATNTESQLHSNQISSIQTIEQGFPNGYYDHQIDQSHK